MSPPPDPRRVIAPSHQLRDTLLAVGCGLAVLVLVIYGIGQMANAPKEAGKNILTGTIVAKHAAGQREQAISMGKGGFKTEVTDTGYAFDILVKAEGRTYTVPVVKALYDAKKVGESQEFARPPSEQR